MHHFVQMDVIEDVKEGLENKIVNTLVMDANEDVKEVQENNVVNTLAMNANEDVKEVLENNVVNTLAMDANEDVVDTKKQDLKRTYAAMNGFKEITLSNGVKKAKCVHCDTKIVVDPPGGGGGTARFREHFEQCRGHEETNKKRLIMSYKTRSVKIDNVRILKDFKYDQEKVRYAAAGMVIVNKCLFKMFKSKVFNSFVNSFNPKFEKIPPRIARSDCLVVYENEKEELKALLETVDQLSLTAELWPVGLKAVYVCLIGYFFDTEQKLQKRLLGLCDAPPLRSGLAISDAIFQCLLDWGIENKVSSITVDCSSASGVALDHLKLRIGSNQKLLFGGKVFHQRCHVHIIDLMAQDGLHEIRNFVDKIRESVKYLSLSKERLLKFSEIVKQLHMPSKKLILDDSTCWNATYSMVVAAVEFRDVFPRYQVSDPDYYWLPTSEDWERGEQVCQILKVLDSVKNDFLGSEHLTAEIFMSGIWRIREVLNRKSMAENAYLQAVVLKMKGKFDKFWGELPLLVAIATVLHPRFNMTFLKFWLQEIYPEVEAKRQMTSVRDALYELFNAYVVNQVSSNRGQGMHGDRPKGCSSSTSVDTGNDKDPLSRIEKEFELYLSKERPAESNKSELDKYLEDVPYSWLDKSFNALEWWKGRRYGYDILSKLACDILSIPIVGATSRSALGTLHRNVDHYRASRSKETVQALICAADWLKCSNEIKSLPDVSILFVDIGN